MTYYLNQFRLLDYHQRWKAANNR